MDNTPSGGSPSAGLQNQCTLPAFVPPFSDATQTTCTCCFAALTSSACLEPHCLLCEWSMARPGSRGTAGEQRRKLAGLGQQQIYLPSLDRRRMKAVLSPFKLHSVGLVQVGCMTYYWFQAPAACSPATHLVTCPRLEAWAHRPHKFLALEKNEATSQGA